MAVRLRSGANGRCRPTSWPLIRRDDAIGGAKGKVLSPVLQVTRVVRSGRSCTVAQRWVFMRVSDNDYLDGAELENLHLASMARKSTSKKYDELAIVTSLSL